MKKKTLLIAGLAAMMFGCQKMDPERSLPTIQASGAVNFEARYCIPLTDDMIGNGEEEIVDPIRARDLNEAILHPVFVQIVNNAIAGTLPTYPEPGFPDPQNDPSTYLSRTMESMRTNNHPFTAANLLQRIEIEYQGVAENGHSSMVPKGFDLVYVDLNEEFPDKIIANIRMSDLVGYQVTEQGQQISLSDYLSGHRFEEYVIGLTTPADTFRVRSYSESQALMVDIDAGDVANLRSSFQPPM
jgi:hypothetical protein